jgi:hypothetical protein
VRSAAISAVSFLGGLPTLGYQTRTETVAPIPVVHRNGSAPHFAALLTHSVK